MSNAQPAGELALTITKRANRSVATKQYHRGVLRVIRPHYDTNGRPNYTIINPGGAYFGGDRYTIDITVEPAADLTLTTQSATKVYRTPQGPACQDMTIRLGADASLDYLPDQLIVYEDGTYRQNTIIELAPTARLALAEIITPGWSPDGKWFSFQHISMNTEVYIAGETNKLLLIDNLRMVPAETNISGWGFQEGYSHSGQLLLVEPGLAAEQVLEIMEASPTYSGLSTMDNHCLFIRSLANSTADLEELHHQILQLRTE